MHVRLSAGAAVAVAAVLGLSGCATAPRSVPRGGVLAMPAMEIQGDAQLARMNDEELFANGASAYAAEDWARAVACYERLLATFPDSPHRRDATYDAGLAFERLHEWERARQRFGELARPAGTGDALDAAFHLAEALYQLQEYRQAAVLLRSISAREDLKFGRRVEAQVQQGICELESGELDTAERTLRGALAAWQGAAEKEVLDDYFPAQAQFFLGEVYRLHYASVVLDPDQGADALSRDLEYKAELLLSAQGHYLRTIKVGNGYWATAAGTQIGKMYEDLHAQMLESRAPRELNAEEAKVYREELRKKIRVLVEKAIAVYESTLAAAERIGSSGPFVERARDSLQRMKDLLLAEPDEDATAVDPAAAKPPARRPPMRSKARGLEQRPESPTARAPTHDGAG